jgi:hypothetical protein
MNTTGTDFFALAMPPISFFEGGHLSCQGIGRMAASFTNALRPSRIYHRHRQDLEGKRLSVDARPLPCEPAATKQKAK